MPRHSYRRCGAIIVVSAILMFAGMYPNTIMVDQIFWSGTSPDGERPTKADAAERTSH